MVSYLSAFGLDFLQKSVSKQICSTSAMQIGSGNVSLRRGSPRPSPPPPGGEMLLCSSSCCKPIKGKAEHSLTRKCTKDENTSRTIQIAMSGGFSSHMSITAWSFMNAAYSYNDCSCSGMPLIHDSMLLT